MIRIARIDHLVLTVRDIARTCTFYHTVLGMHVVTFGGTRTALHFGPHKLNLHLKGHELEPKARHPTTGAIDLCLITATPLDDVVSHLRHCQVPVELGIVDRTGAMGPIRSVYIRNPDDNLIEIANEVEPHVVSTTGDAAQGTSGSIVEAKPDNGGERQPYRSVYIRDPDDNLIEIANEVESHAVSTTGDAAQGPSGSIL